MNLKKQIHKTLPWVIAAGIFAYLFHLYSPKKIYEAMTYMNIPAFVGFSLFYFLCLYTFDSIAISQTLKILSHPIKLKDTFIARGVTYLIMIINYPASQAAFAYYLKRRYNMPIFNALGAFLIITFVDLLWIISLAFTGSFFQVYKIESFDLGKSVRLLALIAYIIIIGWIIFWRFFAQKINSKNIPIISKLLSREAFKIFINAKLSDYLKIFILRAPIYVLVISFMYIIIQTFGAYIPFTQIICNVPLVFLLGTIPITPGGLGTSNIALVELLSPHVTGEVLNNVSPKQLIFAVSLLWVFINYALKALVGCILLRKVSKQMFEETSIPEEKLEEEAGHLGGNL